MDGDTTQYVLDLAGALPVVISDTHAIYLYGLDIVAQQQAERLYYMHDGLGSVRQLTDETGQIATNYAYDPFGVPLTTGSPYNPYRYTGEAWDAEVELLYLRARYYQPATGRFVSRDASQGDVSRPGTLNAYVYVGNNPVNYVDLSGRQWIRPTPTPTPTAREREILESAERAWYQSLCRVATTPTQTRLSEMWEISAVNPGVGLLHQRTVVSGERILDFRMLYASFQPPFLDLITGVVKSSLEAIVSIYTNGTYVDIFDAYDTSGLEAFRPALAFEPMLHRSVDIWTTRGAFDTAHFFGDVGLGQRGSGHVQGVWFRSDEGWPSKMAMYLAVSEIAARGIAQPVNSYSVRITYPQGHGLSR